MQKGGVEKIYIGLKMAPVSRTGGGQIRTGTTGKLPEIVRRTGVYFRPCYAVFQFRVGMGSKDFDNTFKTEKTGSEIHAGPADNFW